MLDFVVFIALVVGFATFVTAHFALILALTFVHRPRWRGALALLLPPLAAMWGWQAGRRKTTVLWGLALLVYTVAMVIAQLD